MACKEALSWLQRRGVREVELLSDSQILVSAFQQGDLFVCHSYLGSIIEDCRSLSCSFDVFSIAFVRRTSNMVAHKLARKALDQSGSWELSPPLFVTHLINS